MIYLTLLDFVNLFFAGMLAGIEFVIHYGFHAPTTVLDDRSQLQLRQALVIKLRVLVPAFFIPTALLGIVLTFFNFGVPGFSYRLAEVAAILVWIAIRVVGTVSINSATVEWQLDAPPANWKAQVNNAERYHIVGVWAAILSFVFCLVAVAMRLTIQ